MTTLPSKPKRSAGAFLTIWQGVPKSIIWIEENYNLYRMPNKRMSKRGKQELERDRERHIDDSVQIKIDGCLYVVNFMFDTDDDTQYRIVKHYHDKLTIKVNFDE